MKTRFVGVVAAFAAIVVVFAVVVLTIAAIQDYQENKGQSFIERAAGIVGIGTLTEDVAQVTVEVDDGDVDELEKRSSDPPDIFRFFGRSEDNEEWLDDLLEREWPDREYEYRFEDRLDRSTERLPFESFEELPFSRFDFEGPWGSDWVEEFVERGWITEEDADEFKSWFDDLPDSFDRGMPSFSGDREFEFDSDDGRFRFRWRWDKPDDDWFFESDPEYDKDAENGI
ncbi:MAG: hypothetical protein OXC83_00655 [Chloroflexi bacterium]|nr:hypothetical protein [Chloroflexota bacterium]